MRRVRKNKPGEPTAEIWGDYLESNFLTAVILRSHPSCTALDGAFRRAAIAKANFHVFPDFGSRATFGSRNARAIQKDKTRITEEGHVMKTLTADQVKVGFIGLGNMGSRMARRLLDHGYHLEVYDRDPVKAEAMATNGGVVAKNIFEMAHNVDVLISCLTNDEAVHKVYTGADGFFAGAQAGTVVFEMSTISPESSRELHKIGATRGIEVMDVAISGSTPAAEKGILTLLAGGNRELFGAAKPIFELLAKQYFLLGGPGSGTAMKLVVNTLLGVGMQAIAEAVVLGEKAGLDRKNFLEVLSQTAVITPAHVGKLARIAIDDYTAQFPLRLMNKDFKLILQAATEARIAMPATEAAFRVNSEELAGGEEEDFSAVVRRMEEIAGIASDRAAQVAS